MTTGSTESPASRTTGGGGRSSGPRTTGGRTSAETSRITIRRLRSAFFLWKASLRARDAAVAGVIALVFAGIGAYLYSRATRDAQVAFDVRAGRLQSALVDRLTQPVEDLVSLRSFFEASGSLSRTQFRFLTGPMLLRHRMVYAFEWLPRVPRDRRAVYEKEARASGLASYRFWEASADGSQRDAGDREEFVPIHYMEPPNSGALGFDVASDSARTRTAEKARDSGQISSSPPFRLIEDRSVAGAAPVIALYAPVYRGGDPGSPEARASGLLGFANAIVRVAPLVENAASSIDASGLGFVLRDQGAPDAPPLAERPVVFASPPRRPGFDTDFPIAFTDRLWNLSVFALPNAFLPAKRSAVEVAALGALGALLALVAVTSLRTISRLRRQVEKVGPYRLTAKLGHGAMGVVWEARHALLRRPTAVKLLAPGTEGERSLARFEREVQLTAGLTHPSTIAIYDYGRTGDGVFYYAMELLHGINLWQLVILDGPLPPSRVVHLLRQACGALSEAHAAGLIHRDIKPANLMICVYGGIPDFLKVLDFGLVKDLAATDAAGAAPGGSGRETADPALSQDGSLLGTPLYMAPEGMSDPSHVDVRADIFALGAVGYYLLTGRSPFPGRTAIEVFAKERQGPPPPIADSGVPAVPEALEAALRRCLSFDRDRRPDTADELDGLLESCRVAPWTREQAKAWWREKGPAALESARAQRQEGSRALSVGSRAS
ncbi:MAG TPA: CHASE domain-containing protein [Thermoanaerobaculia bacterium]|nr:CHASE domain-containing protein [Thermoanaerobaculia bacterium]